MDQASYNCFHLGTLSFYTKIKESHLLGFASPPTTQNLSELYCGFYAQARDMME